MSRKAKLAGIKTKIKLLMHRYAMKVASFSEKLPHTSQKVLLKCTVPLVMGFAPAGVFSAYSQSIREAPKKELIAKFASTAPAQAHAIATKFNHELNSRVDEMQGELFLAYAAEMSRTIKEIKAAAKRKRKSVYLKKRGAPSSRYYCGLSFRILGEIAQECGLSEEYQAVLSGVKNPDACLSIIEGLKEEDQKINGDILSTLEQGLDEDSSQCAVVVHKSRGNTSSGYHVVVVVKDKVYAFNGEKDGVSIYEYFKGERNTGYFFNIGKRAEEKYREKEIDRFWEKYYQQYPQHEEMYRKAVISCNNIKQEIMQSSLELDAYRQAIAKHTGPLEVTDNQGKKTLVNAFQNVRLS